MKFRRDPDAGVRDGDQYAVHAAFTLAAPLGPRNNFCDSAFPEMGFGSNRHATVGRRMLERVVHQIRYALL